MRANNGKPSFSVIMSIMCRTFLQKIHFIKTSTMLFFFGNRASKIKDRKIRKTVCPYCATQDSFTVSTFSKYFHFFWIPIIPLFKTHVAECSHCKKTYAKHEFSPEMNAALQRENEINPAKRPIWQGCGCIVLVGFFSLMFAISLYGVYMRSNDKEGSTSEKDTRKTLLDNDFAKLSSLLLRDKDSISVSLKDCIDYDIESGIDTNKIEYYTSLKENKILVLLRIKDLKGVDPKERKVVIDIIEDCLEAMPYLDGIEEQYIGVEGKWNTVLVKTPTDEDLGGRFADKYKLLPFYSVREKESDTIQNVKKIEIQDSLNID